MINDEQAIRNLVSTWPTARGDDDQVLTLMSDDVVFLTPGRPPMSKRDFAAGQTALKQFRLQMENSIQEIKVLGDYVYCWGSLTVVITPRNGGAPIKRSGSTLSILQKTIWRMAHRSRCQHAGCCSRRTC